MSAKVQWTVHGGSYKPWFNSECKKAVKPHQNAMDKCCINPTSDNINEYKKIKETL